MAALTVDTDEYKAFAQRLKAADRKVASGLRRRVRDAAKPLGDAIAKDGPEGLPSSGGLADWLRQAKPGLSMTQTRMAIKLTGLKGSRTQKTSDLNAINRGRLRHPVYAVDGRKAGWVNQPVQAGTYDAAIEKHSVDALSDIGRVLDEVMGELQ